MSAQDRIQICFDFGLLPRIILSIVPADLASRMDLITNKDGSADIYMGPDAPERKESNWIPTVKGKAWFSYFRLYSPMQAILDRSWVLPDIEKAE